MQDLARGVDSFERAFHLFDVESREVELEVETELVPEPVVASVVVDEHVLLDSWYAVEHAELAELAEPSPPRAEGRLAVPLIVASGLLTALVTGLATVAL